MTQKSLKQCSQEPFLDRGGAVLHFVIAVCLLNVHCVHCFACSKSKCDQQCPDLSTLDCSNGPTTLDLCDCCKVCLRDENETCGGQNGALGICKDGLRCVLSGPGNVTLNLNSTGTCQKPDYVCSIGSVKEYYGCLYKEEPADCWCTHVTSCNEVDFPFSTSKECKQNWKAKEELRVKSESELKCLNVTCNIKEEPCPADSYRSSNNSDGDECCPQHQKCECLPTVCKDIKCPKGLFPKVLHAKTGMPGSCCTLFECINETEAFCQFENGIYQNGANWKKEKCVACSCKNGMTFCQAITCDSSVICGYMSYPKGECCPVCNGCVSPSGKFYNNSVMWKEDDCTMCQCIEGKLHCQSEMCQPKCAHPLTIPGTCCPVCTEPLDKLTKDPHPFQTALSPFPAHDTCRVEKNKEYGPEEMWYDGCRQCYCHSGREMCAILTCPLLHCDHPRTLPNQCCPVCSGDPHAIQPYSSTICQAVDGRYHVEGESWSLDPCTWCICIKGQVLCEATQCPPTPCPHPVRHLGSCCTTCPEKHSVSSVSSYCNVEDEMVVYGEGQQWRATPCKSCICLHGNIQCYQESCPPVDCSHPLMVKHRCCPVCLGQKNSQTLVCLHNGHTYRDGEHWAVNVCTTCSCFKGMQMCTEKVCPPWCSRPVHVPGQCCPLCEGESTSSSSSSDYGPQPSQLSLAIVIICATIMVLLVIVIVFLVMAVLRQGKRFNRTTCQGIMSQGIGRGPRPKSTNLELQGMSPCSKPLLDSNELKKLQDQGNAVMKNMV